MLKLFFCCLSREEKPLAHECVTLSVSLLVNTAQTHLPLTIPLPLLGHDCPLWNFSLQNPWWALCKTHSVLFRLVCERKSIVFTLIWPEVLNMHLLKLLFSFPATVPASATFPVGALRVVPVMCKLVSPQNHGAVWVGKDLKERTPCHGMAPTGSDCPELHPTWPHPSHQLVWISFPGSVFFHETSESQIKCFI